MSDPLALVKHEEEEDEDKYRVVNKQERVGQQDRVGVSSTLCPVCHIP